jgi:hypothetical protein
LTSLSIAQNRIRSIANDESKVGQLKFLNKLNDLNLDGNPVTQETFYQRDIIFELPHLIYLDNAKVAHGEPKPGNLKKFVESRHILQDLEQWMIKKGYSCEVYKEPVAVISRELHQFHLDLFEKEKRIRACIDAIYTRIHEHLQHIDNILGAKQDDERGKKAMNAEINFGQELHKMIDHAQSEFSKHSESAGAALEIIDRLEWNSISPLQKKEIRQKVAASIEQRIERFRNHTKIQIDAMKEISLQQHCKRVTQISSHLDLN